MTMNIGLIAVDSNYPNLALMKLSAWHKSRGDAVEWYMPFSRYDRVYMAKVFTFTPDYGYYVNAEEVEKGGTGYDLQKEPLTNGASMKNRWWHVSEGKTRYSFRPLSIGRSAMYGSF